MHVFKCQAVGDVINALAVPVVTESFGCNHVVYLFLCGQSQTVHVGLCQYYTISQFAGLPSRPSALQLALRLAAA